MKYLKYLLLLVFLISACSPATTTTSSSTPTQTLTSSPTATQTPSPTPTITPTPTQIGGGSGKFIFEYYKAAYEKSFPDLKGELNVFISNIDGTGLTPITNGLKGLNRIESISADGQMVLVSSRSGYSAMGDLNLIRLNSLGADPMKLAGGVETTSRQAIFLDNARVLYIGQGRQGYGFYIINIDGTGSKKIGAPAGRVWWIVSSDKTRVYWESIRKEYFRDSSGSLYMYGDFGGLWWTNIDGSGQGKLESNGQQIIGSYAFSHDGKMLAWIPKQTEPDCAWGALYTKWITDGTYTQWGGVSRGIPYDNPGSSRGEIIDGVWVDAYVRRCFVMYVASLPELNNPIRIVLMPPANLFKGDFIFGKEYDLIWEPGRSMLLLFNNGYESYFVGIDQEPLLYYVIDVHKNRLT